MNNKWIKWGFAIISILVFALWAGLYRISNGHIIDYAIWRWMVTFNRPVRRVDDFRIVIHKSDHQLFVYEEDQQAAAYTIALSQYGLAPRETWEDSLTPEGEFLIASMQYKSIFGPRQMLLDTTQESLNDYFRQYGEEGQERIAAWEEKHGPLDTIWETYDFNESNPEVPMWNDILIHGGGTSSDWTIGCIALENQDVITLFDLIHGSQNRGLGVPVEIRP